MPRNRKAALAKKPRAARCRYVYKYGRVETPEQLDWLRDLLLNHRIYFPKPRELNDPHEARPKFARSSREAFREMLFRGYLAANPRLTHNEQVHALQVLTTNLNHYGLDFVIQAGQETLGELLTYQRIYSLTRRSNNAHLWKEYAADHHGYCLQFRRSNLFGLVMEVRYRNRVEFDATSEHVSAAFFFYKRRKWAREEELRIVFPRNPVGHFPFEPKVLTRIYLGKHIPPEKEARIREWARQRSPTLPVESEPDLLF